ncbi:MarR family winged helix-turn-helix transcriptional regulator [Shimia sagamensis]|mgnify:CR=1 FL=1|uniref:Transcriptional regulator, MarR family n=1 Tax=Shimia sagamensis TaxID=1566352 RepID=A0ABY1NF83_9RHOB|nr:MarR family transcriptional regulator [Shimia sagamensis]SMP08194.1 transcriptional regulator, MarR family [Shimia sagamensis]
MPDNLFSNTDLPDEFLAIIGVFALFNQIEAELEDINIDPPLSKMERRILVFMDRPKRMGVLAEDTFCIPSAITPVADALEARGLVQRVRDPKDRRALVLELTPDGFEARASLMDGVKLRFREISGMTVDEISQFANLVVKAMPGAVAAGRLEEKEC